MYIVYREEFHSGWILLLGTGEILRLTPDQKKQIPFMTTRSGRNSQSSEGNQTDQEQSQPNENTAEVQNSETNQTDQERSQSYKKRARAIKKTKTD
ncbi:hypothetical protein F442_00129 [Phytophthora nicotianae P10297]|uniref:Uncharacterized protein n=3 Tax=Phytophthora nicotianae TaxID=4792 RepID=V9G2F4_PHYNI|nr:hypothetical protein F443_00138 [Phytophthora nicotianae P1569]ETO86318.1 hypothetical protein F444_00134 [Phytophthora nicotianae P1976]ETP55347.1 hypothetical protein F442_00129 [Phytophthora nicotianae P10297]